jgi:hypothetical protein
MFLQIKRSVRVVLLYLKRFDTVWNYRITDPYGGVSSFYFLLRF